MPDESLALQLHKRGERRLDRALGGPMHVEHDSQVDEIEHIQA